MRSFIITTTTAVLLLALPPQAPAQQASAQEKGNWWQKFQELTAPPASEAEKRPAPNDVKYWNAKPTDFFEDKSLVSLCHKIYQRDPKCVAEAVNSDVKINTVGKQGMTVLYWAFMEGNLPAFKQLLEAGADPDVVVEGNLKLVSGKDFLYDERTAVVWSAFVNDFQRPGFFEPAIRQTKKPNFHGKPLGTLLHHSAKIVRIKDTSLVRMIIASKVDLNAKNRKGETAAHVAVAYNPVVLLEILKAGADPTIPLPDGRTLIQIVRKNSTDPENGLNEYYDRTLAWIEKNHPDL